MLQAEKCITNAGFHSKTAMLGRRRRKRRVLAKALYGLLE
jgi:hypothetical protein